MIEIAPLVHPPGEVVVSMRPVSVFANSPGSETEQIRRLLRGPWRQGLRAVMVLLSLHGLEPAQIAALLDCHPGVQVWYGARYSPNDNPAERIWAALKAFIANTATGWPGRRRQVHAFFRARSPDQMLATAAPWTSPWLPPRYTQNLRKAA